MFGKQGLVKPVRRLIFFCLVLFLCTQVVMFLSEPGNLPGILAINGLDEKNYESILAEVLPGKTSGQVNNLGILLNNIVFLLTSIEPGNPSDILGSELCLGNIIPGTLAALAQPEIQEGGEEDFYLPGQDQNLEDWISIPEDEFPPVQLDGEPMLLIYNTHNAETYKPTDGVSRLEGKNGGVADVSSILTKALESKHHLKTVYSNVIHDYPDFAKSYINSMRTVQQVLKKYNKIQVVLDIHRDAGLNSRADTLAKINGKNCAKVMIVVGTEHPNWKQNLAFAQKIAATADKMYPGLIKSVRPLKDRRYNQHLHPHALLLEFGSDLNTREDSTNSAVLMADVLAAVLKG